MPCPRLAPGLRHRRYRGTGSWRCRERGGSGQEERGHSRTEGGRRSVAAPFIGADALTAALGSGAGLYSAVANFLLLSARRDGVCMDAVADEAAVARSAASAAVEAAAALVDGLDYGTGLPCVAASFSRAAAIVPAPVMREPPGPGLSRSWTSSSSSSTNLAPHVAVLPVRDHLHDAHRCWELGATAQPARC